jgi:hypothetical protein
MFTAQKLNSVRVESDRSVRPPGLVKHRTLLCSLEVFLAGNVFRTHCHQYPKLRCAATSQESPGLKRRNTNPMIRDKQDVDLVTRSAGYTIMTPVFPCSHRQCYLHFQLLQCILILNALVVLYISVTTQHLSLELLRVLVP